MEPRRSGRGHSAPAIVLLALLAATPVVAAAGVAVSLQPASQTVSPGGQFDLSLEVTQTGSPFNAFDAVVSYDPLALTLVVLSPVSLQEGTLMTAACANRFHRFRTGVDADTITDVLLCSDVSVTGPGQVYRLRFLAAPTLITTTVHLMPGVRFYDAGISVTPVSTGDAIVQIGAVSGVAPGSGASGPLRLRSSPNPFRSLTQIVVESDAAGPQELTICDLLGRAVRRLGSGWFDAGRREIPWDGRDEAGAPVAPGFYFAHLRTPAQVVRAPIVRLE